MAHPDSASFIALVDGIAGHTSQTRGVAAALDVPVTEVPVIYGPLAGLPNWMPVPPGDVWGRSHWG